MRVVMGLLLSVAACAASESGTGSGSGSGSGSSDQITLDPTGFVVDGTRWWTDTSGPRLTGAIAGDGGTLRAYIGTQAVGEPATIDGVSWSLQLPDGTIGTGDTTIDLVLEVAGKPRIGIEQIFDLDTGAPNVTIDAKLHDERGDTISFASGEAVHTHAGAMIDLSSGCPDVYKYAYLTATSAPPYGSETWPNPIVFRFTPASPVGIDAASSAVRVRLDDGTVAVDWALLEGTGTYPFALYRDGSHAIPQLATYDGKIYVDARFHDAFGHETVATSCFHYHPMAAPLEIRPIAHESAGTYLWNMSLPADSPVSWLLGQHDTAVIGQRFVQHAAEPITVQVQVPRPDTVWSKVVADHYVAIDNGTLSLQCGTKAQPSTDPRCLDATYTDVDSSTIGTLSAGATWHAVVIDESTGQLVTGCTGASCTLPARPAGQPPHAYRAIAYLGYVYDLWPMSSVPSEQTLLGRTYTGYAPTTVYKCSHRTLYYDSSEVLHYECQYTTYAHFIAIKSATLDFVHGFQTSFSTSVGGSVALSPIAYQPDPMTSLSSVWDSQTDVLPGQ